MVLAALNGKMVRFILAKSEKISIEASIMDMVVWNTQTVRYMKVNGIMASITAKVSSQLTKA